MPYKSLGPMCDSPCNRSIDLISNLLWVVVAAAAAAAVAALVTNGSNTTTNNNKMSVAPPDILFFLKNKTLTFASARRETRVNASNAEQKEYPTNILYH